MTVISRLPLRVIDQRCSVQNQNTVTRRLYQNWQRLKMNFKTV